MAEQLRALAAVTGDLSSVPSALIGQLTTLGNSHSLEFHAF